jgi:hypothetical protein
MPWVRIDENIIDHPKFIALTPLAFWLWVEGLTYCQKHLTDGHIPKAVVRGMRHYSPAAMAKLTAVLVSGKGPLWSTDSHGDVHVHDYLTHNDSREEILAKRANARDRMRGKRVGRSREQSGEQSGEHPGDVPHSVTLNSVRGGDCIPSGSEGKERGSGKTKTLTERAGAFCDWYQQAHSEVFNLGYIGNPNKDYMVAQDLCRVFTDQELQDATYVWFGMDDKWATESTRTIPRFASRATKCVEKARKVTA